MFLTHALRAISRGVAVVTDPFFKYVSLLLTGDGTNGAQNNTFLDSSTNNFAVTRNGNTTQGTFSPYGANWSNYFDNTGDYLTVPSTVQLEPGSGNFTIEAWVYPLSYPSAGTGDGIITRSNSSGYNNFSVNLRSNGNIEAYFSLNSPASVPAIITAGSILLNSWTHIAFVKNGLSTTLYVNGVSVGTATAASHPPTGLSTVTSIGTADSDFNGYISNVRIVKGTAVYTAAFTPPTAPLTAIANTSLLTCQSNRFIDNSTNNFAITKNGDVRVQRFSPFNPSASYSSSVIGGSAYFGGTGNYLSFNPSTSFAFGTGDFTVEGWVYPTISNTEYSLFDSATNGAYWSLRFTASSIYYQSASGQANKIIATNVLTDKNNSWFHVAIVRLSGISTLYLNGVSVGSTSDAINYSTATTYIMGKDSDGYYFTGYISNARVVKGTAVYTAAFTPPTAPVTAITNTSLLLNFTGAGIIDNAMISDLETVGNAQISTAQSKFGGSSMYFDGTGDYLSIPNSAWMNLGTTFTIEFWFYRTATQAMRIVSRQDNSPPYNGYNISYGEVANTWYFDASASSITFADGGLANQWVHYAWVVNGTSGTVYRNGVSVGAATQTAQTPSTNTTLLIGAREGPTNYVGGYIDDLRITKGYARYTANFTPPTAALPTS
jgi:hypothetical protein